jgi:hypothetical protein
MNKLDKVLRNYLEARHTDYAIMINGEWGSGKSYYMRYSFPELARSIVVPGYAPKGVKRLFRKKEEPCTYAPAFISLYGLSSSEDFNSRVFAGVHEWTEGKAVRSIGMVADSLVSKSGLSIDRNSINSMTPISADRVLVFDDLERICENKISCKEVLGLINNYSEHEGKKVIILCNEQEYVSGTPDEKIKLQYRKYKEKIVRYTYRFTADASAVFDSMVENAGQQEDSDYISYLRAEKERILDLFALNGENNLRSLGYFIQSFEQVFQCLRKFGQESRLPTVLATYMLYITDYMKGRSKEQLDGYRPDHPDFQPNPALVEYVITGYLDEEKMRG